jgi:hypothetical protein
MSAFTRDDMLWLRTYLDARYPMQRICNLMARHSRDEVVEAIDALRRSRTLNEARERANFVLAEQSAGQPLINGNRQGTVARQWSDRPVYRAMF